MLGILEPLVGKQEVGWHEGHQLDWSVWGIRRQLDVLELV